jgi:predicted RNA binding protein YcfA (HicA-like mRNA interferase family)
MKWRALVAVLERAPLNYRLVHQSGSHAKYESDRYPPILIAPHSPSTIPPRLVRKILTKDVGLSVDEALALL